ncbi:MAG: beta-class carbonic anhydrase [Acidimicrobiales bacterium]
MTDLDQLLAATRRHAAEPGTLPTVVPPTERLAVVTCMDVRIDPLAVFGLHLGQAHVLRNAGARVTDDVLRSLALSTRLMAVDTVVLLAHTGCGLFGVGNDELRRRTGAPLDFLPIADHHEALRQDVARLAATPYLALRTVAGLLYDVATKEVTLVERHQR